MTLQYKSTNIYGVYEIFPAVHRDGRGFFTETYNKINYDFLNTEFVQDNMSCSQKGVLRGLHFQTGEHAQAKLVRVVSGLAYDVAVDIRKDSPTYGHWCGVILYPDQMNQFFIPRGCAHGFLALEDNTVFEYKCDNLYCKESEGGIDPFDDHLNINWFDYIDRDQMILSDKDLNRENFIW
jgi:dTDP-4-dehydrorhamnose 3,5-epimerase